MKVKIKVKVNVKSGHFDMFQKLKFIDFCAGIGGGRLGLEQNNLDCVGYAELNKDAASTYKILYGEDEQNQGDLMQINPANLPEFDLMLAGFPCQTFSIAGQRKGFEDARGQVIYGLLNILKARQPKFFILENVKGLVNHQKGQTLQIIINLLKMAGYHVQYKVLNSLNHGVPQMRERVYIVGARFDMIENDWQFTWPDEIKTPDLTKYLIDTENQILNHNYNDNNHNNSPAQTFKNYLNNKYNIGKYQLDEILRQDYLVLDTRQSDLRLYQGRVPTLRTGRHGILYVKDGLLKKLSGYEALLLQGFTKELAAKTRGLVPETKLLAQAGNAMTASTIRAIANQLCKI